MSDDVHPERAVYRAGPIITGRVVRLLDGYARELKVGQPVLVAVLTAAGLTRLIVAAITSVLRVGAGGGGTRRAWKDLRKGPEFLVTPLRVRTTDGVLCEMEIHGHLPQTAIEPADHVQITVRRQADARLAPRVERIVNLTTGQLLRPRVPTLWSHLGPPLLLQAVVGVLVLAAAVVYLAVAR